MQVRVILATRTLYLELQGVMAIHVDNFIYAGKFVDDIVKQLNVVY